MITQGRRNLQRGTKPTRFTDAQVAAMRADKRAGLTYREISNKWGCSYSYVADLLRRNDAGVTLADFAVRAVANG
jgi:transposase